ncbi:MAG TPA: hypothetical protein VHF22_12495, partial [Planctomycetota bacterium]|nr:hypothetical protein [Planctomycetota bacterium]
KRLDALIDAGDALAGDYNNAAWDRLVAGAADERAHELARTAVQMRRETDPMSLHTLAAICAELGRTAEAQDAILKAIAASGEDAPRPHDWYVLGRIAEDYGERDAAVAAYRRAEPYPADGTDPEPSSSAALARRRLEKLGIVEAVR